MSWMRLAIDTELITLVGVVDPFVLEFEFELEVESVFGESTGSTLLSAGSAREIEVGVDSTEAVKYKDTVLILSVVVLIGGVGTLARDSPLDPSLQ